MGIGDDIIATSLARGAHEKGNRIAFGDGKRIIWGPYSPMIFRNNPNIAPPGSERAEDIRWINYYKGRRLYNKQGVNRWLWNYDFKVRPGELFFDANEEPPTEKVPNNLILIEPNVPAKPNASNKQWPLVRWQSIVNELIQLGFDVRQFEYGGPNHVAPASPTPTFRAAAALMKSARLAILPEGGLHHAAAAVGIPAVVLFGGFAPPEVLGYDGHVNLKGDTGACGSFTRCPHCIDAMNSITADRVLEAIDECLAK